MNKYMKPTLAAFLLLSGSAFAQTTYQSTTTTTAPTLPPGTLAVPQQTPQVVPIPPPAGSLATVHTEHTIAPNGTEQSSKSTVYRNAAGVASQTDTTTSTPAPPAAYETKQTTTTTVIKP